jgi:hypothetical protein
MSPSSNRCLAAARHVGAAAAAAVAVAFAAPALVAAAELS